MSVIRKGKGDDVFATRLRHRVAIERATDTASGADIVQTWRTVRDAWAEIKPLSGREFYQRDQVLADVTHTITMRWDAIADVDVTTKDRMTAEPDRTFNVMSIRNIDERDRVAVVMAKEVID